MSDSLVETNIPVRRMPFAAGSVPPNVPFMSGNDVGSTTKPVFISNREIKPCDLPANATQLGTDANGGIVAISTATTSSTVRCYISPDKDYWNTVSSNGISTANLSTIRTALGMAKIVVDGKEVDGDPFIGNPSISYVVSDKYYFVGIDSETQLSRQLKAHPTNRVFFPLFSVDMACQFLANFRTQTLAQKYEIRCTRGIYFYTKTQTVAHVDVSNGGVSEIIITGMSDDNDGKMSENEYTRTRREKEFTVENNNILSINSSGTSPYRVTFVKQWDDTKPLTNMFSCYGTVRFQYVNFMYGNKKSSGTNKYSYELVTPTTDNWVGKHNTSFITASGCYLKFRSVWCNTGTYVCYNADRITFNSEPMSSEDSVSKNLDNNIANVHLRQYPIQINSSILTSMFGGFNAIYVEVGTYLRAIAQEQVTNSEGHGYNGFRPLFTIRQGCLQIGRRPANPTRIDVRCKHYINNDNSIFHIFTLLDAQSNTGLIWPNDSVRTNPLIKNDRDAVAIYWYGEVSGGGTRSEITDCIPLLTTTTAMTGSTYAVWTTAQQSNMNGFLNDGRELFNRWIHFKKWLNNSNTIIDLSGDFIKPNIVTTSDTNVIDGKFYYVLEDGNWRLAVDNDFNLNPSNKRESFKTGVTYGEASNESDVGRRIANDNVDGGGHFTGAIFVHKATNNF